MRVFAEPYPRHLGYAFDRIDRALRVAAPQGVTFEDHPERCDLQILHVVNTDSLTFLANRPYVLWQHAFLGIGRVPLRVDEWREAFLGARLVVSFMDLDSLARALPFEFLRIPHGVDGRIFSDRRLDRRYCVLTTGDVFGAEAILECQEAARLTGQQVVHTGRPPRDRVAMQCARRVSEEHLASLYARSRYVSGLRRVEGFELPVLEGLVCGARPICFDTPGYRHWFEEHAVFVPEVPPDDLVPHLVRVFETDPEPVTAEERAAVLARFNWAEIYRLFWNVVLQRL